MRKIRLSARVEVECRAKKTKNGFKHVAELVVNGDKRDKAQVHYLNRTWESYEFQSAILKLLNKTKELDEVEKAICIENANKDHTDWSQFKSTGMVAMLGDIFCETQKEKNDWKARMLKAGLGNMGLQIPEDWDTLTEQEREQRLNKVIELARNVPEGQGV
jgi:hypothetical protein